MQENKFERQVQQELQAFSLKPAEEVWLKVEEKIRGKRKRRYLLYILFPLVLGGIGFVIFSLSTKRTAVTVNNETVFENKSGAGSTNREETNVPATGEKVASSHIEKTGNITAPGRKTDQPGSTEDKNRPLTAKNVGVQSPAGKENKGDRINKKVNPENTREKFAKKARLPEKTGRALGNPAYSHEEVIASLEPTRDRIMNRAERIGFNGTYPDQPVFKQLLKGSGIPVRTETDLKKATPGEQTGKPSLDIMVKSGFFKQNEPLVRFGSAQADYNSSPTGGNSQGSPYVPPSSIRSGFSYGAAVRLRYPLGTGNYFLAGIGISFYQTNRGVGSYIDSSRSLSNFNLSQVNGYYRTGSSATYHSRYLYAEVPLAIQWRIRQSDRLPVFVQTGFNYSRLVYSRGLIYSGSNNIYVSDGKLLNKNQLVTDAGLLIGLMPGSDHPVQAGIIFQYGLSRQYRSSVPQNLHSRFIGLTFSRKF